MLCLLCCACAPKHSSQYTHIESPFYKHPCDHDGELWGAFRNDFQLVGKHAAHPLVEQEIETAQKGYDAARQNVSEIKGLFEKAGRNLNTAIEEVEKTEKEIDYLKKH